MKDRLANVLLALAVCAAAVLFAVLPAPSPAAPKSQENGPPSCLWEWTAFGWVIVRDGCVGFCNKPDHAGAYNGDLASTPCLGQ